MRHTAAPRPVCDRSPPTGIIARHKNDIVCWMTLLLHLAWHVSCDLSCWHYCGIQREDILIVVCFVDLISQWNDKVVVVVLLNVWGRILLPVSFDKYNNKLYFFQFYLDFIFFSLKLLCTSSAAVVYAKGYQVLELVLVSYFWLLSFQTFWIS